MICVCVCVKGGEGRGGEGRGGEGKGITRKFGFIIDLRKEFLKLSFGVLSLHQSEMWLIFIIKSIENTKLSC